MFPKRIIKLDVKRRCTEEMVPLKHRENFLHQEAEESSGVEWRSSAMYKEWVPLDN